MKTYTIASSSAPRDVTVLDIVFCLRPVSTAFTSLVHMIAGATPVLETTAISFGVDLGIRVFCVCVWEIFLFVEV